MIRPIATVAMVVLVAACAADAANQPAFTPKPVSVPVEVYFWLNPDRTIADDPRIELVDGHPCGGIAIMQVTSIPDDNAVIESDVYVEFDAQGRELNAWHAPVDFVVDQIHGDLIGISNNRDMAFWIAPDNRMFHRASGESAQTPVECPALERYGDSAYLRCFSTPDLETGKARLIAWPGICT